MVDMAWDFEGIAKLIPEVKQALKEAKAEVPGVNISQVLHYCNEIHGIEATVLCGLTRGGEHKSYRVLVEDGYISGLEAMDEIRSEELTYQLRRYYAEIFYYIRDGRILVGQHTNAKE